MESGEGVSTNVEDVHADDGQQARNSCTGLCIFSLGSHTVFVHVTTGSG